MNIVQFAHKYKMMNYPHDHTLMKRVYFTDVSTSVLVWSEDDFLVELYFMHPNCVIERHSHPFENLVIHYSGELIGTREGSTKPPVIMKDHGAIGNPLAPNHWHEFKTGESGCVLYNISRWSNIEEKESATVRYIGNPLGPVHKKFLDTFSK